MVVQDLLDTGVIRESCSPYASLVVLVWKKDSGLRVCVDFRRFNAKTIKDAYPIPRIAEPLEALHGAKGSVPWIFREATCKLAYMMLTKRRQQ